MLPFAIYLYGPAGGPLPSRFEEAARRLTAIERLHFEWDGSFVWRGVSGGEAWQIDGMVYDRGEQIQYVDLKGRCPLAAWRELLTILAGAAADHLSVLCLPDRRELKMEPFEEEIWGKWSPPEPLA